MRKSIIAMLMIVVCCSCSAQKINVRDLNDLSGLSNEITRHMDRISIFKDIRNKGHYVFTKDDDGKSYVEGEGLASDGAKILFRVGAIASEAANHSFDVNLDASGESCSGVNCSKCSFKKGGGCNCESVGSHLGGPSYCNHSTSN